MQFAAVSLTNYYALREGPRQGHTVGRDIPSVSHTRWPPSSHAARRCTIARTIYRHPSYLSDTYAPVRQIVAIGRNFVDHVKELNNTVPKEPFFFLKPTSSYITNGQQIEIPRGVVAHHEGSFFAHHVRIKEC